MPSLCFFFTLNVCTPAGQIVILKYRYMNFLLEDNYCFNNIDFTGLRGNVLQSYQLISAVFARPHTRVSWSRVRFDNFNPKKSERKFFHFESFRPPRRIPISRERQRTNEIRSERNIIFDTSRTEEIARIQNRPRSQTNVGRGDDKMAPGNIVYYIISESCVYTRCVRRVLVRGRAFSLSPPRCLRWRRTRTTIKTLRHGRFGFLLRVRFSSVSRVFFGANIKRENIGARVT